jgi:hypothetical protein
LTSRRLPTRRRSPRGERAGGEPWAGRERPTTGGPDRRNWIAGIGAAWIGVVALLLILGSPIGRGSATASPTSPTPSTAVAAGSPGATATPPEASAGGDTFDRLRIDSPLPSPWTVSGSVDAAVIALPTSVDRSVRLRSSTNGVATVACRPVSVPDPSAVRVSVDLLVGSLPRDPAPVLVLRRGDSTVLQLVLASDGSIASVTEVGDVIVEGAGAAPEPSGSQAWRHLDVAGPLEIDSVCFASPQGVASGWIAVDNLVIGE